MSFHSIHNVADRGVLQAMWEELTGKVGHCDPRLSENAVLPHTQIYRRTTADDIPRTP